MDFQEVITALPGMVNIVLLIALMALGYIIKHTPVFAKVSNNLIPIILPVTSIAVSAITGDLTTSTGVVTAIMTGFINAALAVWAHETGKNVFEMLNKINGPGDSTEGDDSSAL